MSIVLSLDPAPPRAGELAPEQRARLDQIIDEEHADPAALIPILHAAQTTLGHLPPAVQDYVAARLRMPVSAVHGVVTFYSLFVTEPQGKHSVHVCMGTACYVRGASRLLEGLEQQFGVTMGRTTRDGSVTLGQCRCLGVCDRAPALMIDDKVVGPASTGDVVAFLEERDRRERS